MLSSVSCPSCGARFVSVGVVLTLVPLLLACQQQQSTAHTAVADSAHAVEADIVSLPLGAPLNQDDMEISGLAWKGDTLVVLPQYPSRHTSDGTFQAYGLTRTDIEHARTSASAAALQPIPIPIRPRGLRRDALSYEGCEAIAFANGRVYVLIEAHRNDIMRGFLLTGSAPSTDTMTVDVRMPHVIPAQAPLANMAYEALTVWHDTLLALYEANGGQVNPKPKAHQFNAAAEPVGAIPFPALEYRLTDATSVDADGRFWVTNYFYPGERDVLVPATDSLRLQSNIGATHDTSDVVERLVEYEYRGSEIVRTETPPLWLKLDGGTGRNWEGVVRFGNGFLIATDQYPHSMLAYVEPPEGSG